MAQIQVEKRVSTRETDAPDAPRVDTKAVKARRDELTGELDDLLDEIDELLGENESEMVDVAAQYVQRGGE